MAELSTSLKDISLMEAIASMPVELREAVYRSLPVETAQQIPYDWRSWARPNQLPPATDWSFWLLLAGRGFGKTRTGAEWIRSQKDHVSRIALVCQVLRPAGVDAPLQVDWPAESLIKGGVMRRDTLHAERRLAMTIGQDFPADPSRNQVNSTMPPTTHGSGILW